MEKSSKKLKLDSEAIPSNMKSGDPLDVGDLDYLNDIIPYRCPKCRDERKFSSLSDLRLHLDKNHSYQVGYVRPRARMQVFDAKSEKTKENNSINEGKRKTSSPRLEIRSSDGRSSPLLLSFKEDARILESQLRAAKEAEMRNKERSYHRKTGHVNESGTIDSLHQKLMSSRNQQWKAEEALYSIDSVLDNLEKSVEMRFRDQRGVISDLASSLDNREEQLSQANLTLKSLQKERQKLMRETQEVLQQSGIKNERLKFELERRDDVLHSVKSQLHELRVKTEESIRLRDNELMLTKDRVHHLELEKETLLRDVEELMRASDQDSVHLKQALGTKERQLKLVNNELLKIRNEQSDLMNESVKLYEAAEMGNEKLKRVIQTKDSKLQQAEMELVKLRKMQDDLVSESQLLTEQADSHSQAMKGVLTEKESTLSTLRQELERVIQERNRLVTAVETREQGMNSEAGKRDVPMNSSLEQEKMRQELDRVVKERDRLLMALETKAPVKYEAHQRHVALNSSSQEQEEMRQELERVMKERDRLMEAMERSPVRGHVMEGTSETDGDSALMKEEKLIQRQNASQNQRVVTPVLSVNDADISKLQSELEEKQAHLEKKERELESLKKFINTTAEKEMVGRQKLEEFISELIDRADQAERELELMRRETRTSHLTKDPTADRDLQKLQRSQKQNTLPTSPANQMPSHNTTGTSGLYSSVARHLVEATVEPWPDSIAPLALNRAIKKTASSSDCENTKGDIKSNVGRTYHPKETPSIRSLSHPSSHDSEVESPESKTKNQPRKSETGRQLAYQSSNGTEVMPPESRKKHQPRKLGSDRALLQQSSNDSEILSDEDSTEYSPLPTNKRYSDNKEQFQRTSSNQSYISQRHVWMDPDSVLYSETMDDPDLERISVDSFNGLPPELHQISGGNPNVVYVPFNRRTGQPIRPHLDPTRHLDPNSDPNQQQNLDNDSTPIQVEASDKMESNKTDLSESSTYSHSEFKEIKPRESPDKGSHRETSRSKSEFTIEKSSKPPKRCEQKPEKDREENVVMKSIGVMANIPSFQGTTTESESCEEMEMAENSLSDVKSFSEDYPLEKQDSFEKELDDNGIIWDLDDHSHHSLIESRRFSPYGSEMKSPPNQGGIIDDSDSLDSVPVKDQSGGSSEYHSAGLGEAGLNSLSFNTYPPRKKQVNFQTLSERSDPVNYNKRPSKYRGYPRNEDYRLLDNETDEDEYEEDIQRWKNFTADINTDLQREAKTGDHQPRSYSATGRYKSPTSSTMSSYEKSQLFNRPEPRAGGQSFAWQREAYPMHLQPSMLPFGEPLQRTMSSPGLYKRFMMNEDVPYFYQNLHSSWRPSIQRGRFTEDVGKRLSSSLSNLNTRAGQELTPRTSVCKDSSTQTWLLDRQLTEKDLHYMEEISSSVSSPEKNSDRMSQIGCKADEVMQKSESKLVDVKPSSNNSCLSSRHPSSTVSLGSNENTDKNMAGSMKDFKSNNIEKSQNTSSSTDVSDNKIFQESNCSKPQSSSSCLQNDDSKKHHSEKNNGNHEKGTDNTDGDSQRSAIRSSSVEELSFPQSTENSTSSAKNLSQRSSDGLGNVGNKCTMSAHNSANDEIKHSSNSTRTVSVDSENCDKSKNSASLNIEENFKQLSKQSSDVKGLDVLTPNDEYVKEDAKQDFTRSDSKSGDSHLESLNKADMCNNVQDNTKCKDVEYSSKGSSAKSTLSKSPENKSMELKGSGSLADSKSMSDSKQLSNSKTMNNPKPIANSESISDSKPGTDSKTMSDSKLLSVSEKSRPLTHPHNDEDDDTSIMTDLSLGSSMADISNQSSNFSNFFNQRKMEEDRMEDPDKDRDCHDDQTMEDEIPSEASREQSHFLSEEKSETSEGMQGSRNSGKLQKQKTMPLVAEFEPFTMAFDGDTKPPVFSEVQETEDEDDLSTLDSCSVTLSSADEMRAPTTSRREETRKRRQALQKIFRFLDVDSLLVVAQVCREWKKVSRNRSLWKRVVLENKKCSSKFLISLSNWCTSVKHLTLKNLSPRDQRQTEADDVYQSSIRDHAEACSAERVLASVHQNLYCRGSLEMGLERLLQVCESTLLSLSIIDCGTLLTDKSIWLASCYSRMLRSVEYLSSSFPLGPDVMYALGAGCRDITTLKIHPIYPCENEEKFSNKCLQIVSQFCSDLEVLSIGGSKVDINGLVLIAKACPRLQHLELHHSQEITSDVAVAVCRLGLKQLLTLAFIHTPVTSDALKHFYKSCKHLKDVQVSLFISDFYQGKAETEDTKLKKWQKFVKDIKSLERIPGLGNILKLSLQNT